MAPTTRRRPLPVAAVHHVLERAPVGPRDRPERAVGRDAKGDQPGAETILREAQQAPRQLLLADRRVRAAMPRSAAASMMLIVAWPRSYWTRSRERASWALGAMSAIVAADLATCPALRHTLASWASCSGSVQTTKSHACWLPAEGVRRPASRIWSRSLGAIASSA